MAENKFPFVEGASIHRPPKFSGVNYQFWKIHMKILMNQLTKAFGMQIWMDHTLLNMLLITSRLTPLH